MGRPHITSDRIRNFNAAIFGAGKYVVDTGSKFSYEIISNNQIKINDGQLISQGTHACIDLNNYEELQIDTGLQGLNRNDLIVARYTRNKITDIESMQMVVIKGTSSEDAADPPYITGDVLTGASEDDMPLYRVRLNGLNIEGIDCLFETIPSLKSMQNDIEALKTANNTKTIKDWTLWRETGYIASDWLTLTVTTSLSQFSEINIVPRRYTNQVIDSIIIPTVMFRTLTSNSSASVKIERDDISLDVQYVNDNTIRARNTGTTQSVMFSIYAR